MEVYEAGLGFEGDYSLVLMVVEGGGEFYLLLFYEFVFKGKEKEIKYNGRKLKPLELHLERGDR